MHTLTINNETDLSLPASWEELTPAQYRRIADLLAYRDAPAIRMETLRRLLPRYARHLLADVDGAQLWAMSDCIAWLWEERKIDEHTEVAPLVPSFWYRGRRYWLPQQSLNDVTVDEWAHIELFLGEYQATPHEESVHLRHLASVICRPRRPWWERRSIRYDGYPRQHFNPERIEPQIARFQNLPPWVLRAVRDYVLSCRQMLHARYPAMWGGAKSSGESFGWKGIMLNLAETQVFGPEQQVRRENIHDVCVACVKKNLQIREMEKKYNQPA